MSCSRVRRGVHPVWLVVVFHDAGGLKSRVENALALVLLIGVLLRCSLGDGIDIGARRMRDASVLKAREVNERHDPRRRLSIVCVGAGVVRGAGILHIRAIRNKVTRLV